MIARTATVHDMLFNLVLRLETGNVTPTVVDALDPAAGTVVSVMAAGLAPGSTAAAAVYFTVS